MGEMLQMSMGGVVFKVATEPDGVIFLGLFDPSL